MRFFFLLFVLLVFPSIVSAQTAPSTVEGVVTVNSVKLLTKAEQDAFLAKRTNGSRVPGRFRSFSSLFFAVANVLIYSDDQSVLDASVIPPFPVGYFPTWAEMFDTIAVQTRSDWKYDTSNGQWKFSAVVRPLPFELKVADKWTFTDRGQWVGYKPPTYPVGMDVYPLGKYSVQNGQTEAELAEFVRNDLAVMFAKNFKPDVKLSDMSTAPVDGVSSLYFETVVPRRPEVMWRQWVFVKDGKAFAIVSTLNKTDIKNVADVKEMVQSFSVK